MALDCIVSADRSVECRHGRFVFPDDEYIGRSIAMLGEYSEQEVRFLCSLLNPGDTVVEAGANVGAITVPLAQAVGNGGFVFAYEPQAVVFDMLERNVQRNTTGNVRVVNRALGQAKELLRYSLNAQNTGNVPLSSVGDEETEVAPLDYDAGNLDCLDLLKIDVEGMETEVLLGARRTIMRLRPLVYAENDRQENSARLLATLFAYGYRVWRHEPPLYDPDNFRSCRTNPWPNVVSFNLIAVPEEKPVPPQVEGLQEVLACDSVSHRIGGSKESWACVVRMGGWGDNLMVSSVLPGLRARYGRVEVIARAPCHAVFENNPYVDKLTVWPKGEVIDDAVVWTKALTHRLAEYAFGVHLSHSCETKLCFFPAQTEFGWPDKARRRLCAQSYLGFIHDVCDLPHEFAPNFFPTDAESRQAQATLDKVRSIRNAPVVGWCLSGSRIDKAYPGSAAVVARLVEAGLNVVMFGAPGKEFLMAKEIERQVVQYFGADGRGSAEGLHLAMSNDADSPNWPMRRSLSTLGLCDAVVTPDTGPAWSVAMRPMPKVVLLSHASPLNITTGWVNTTTLHADPTRVPCWPCHRLHDSFDTCRKGKDVDAAACMADISVNAVVSAVLAGLKAGQEIV